MKIHLDVRRFDFCQNSEPPESQHVQKRQIDFSLEHQGLQEKLWTTVGTKNRNPSQKSAVSSQGDVNLSQNEFCATNFY
jgi:hypothetical protein